MTEHKDMGVVSTKSFTKGELVCEYAGDLITLADGDNNSKYSNDYYYYPYDYCDDYYRWLSCSHTLIGQSTIHFTSMLPD